MIGSRPRRADRPDVAFARRQRARRWSRLRPVAAVLAVAALLGGGAWLLLESPVLGVEQVEVTGTDLLSGATIRAVADVVPGEPLARVDVDGIRARVQDLVEVADVEVRRSWPDTVVVAVTERSSVAVVEREGRIRGMDEEGVLFRSYARRPPGLPLVRISAATRSEALAEAAAVLRALPSVLDGRVAFVVVRTVDDIAVRLRDGSTVVWGSAEDSGNKGDVLAILLEQEPGGAAVREYDVSVPGQPTTRS
ncbi:MAG: FtsQ-type POTRA domain-containing protein [Nocardioides sp.]|nr:FtsQ-type POTRA domain-containing protein [Nocardioides sp.]